MNRINPHVLSIRPDLVKDGLLGRGHPGTPPPLGKIISILQSLSIAALALLATAGAHAEPVVTNVRSKQIAGTHKVEILYDLATEFPCTVAVDVSNDGGATYGVVVPPEALKGDLGANIVAGSRRIELNAGEADALRDTFSKQIRFKVTTPDPPSLEEGLEAHYPFDGDIKDGSGNARHATANGLINYEQGVVGQAASFSASWLQIPNVVNDLQSFSFSLWVNERGMTSGGVGDAESGGEAYIWFGDHADGWAGIASWGDWAGVGGTNVAIEAGPNSGDSYPGRIDQIRPKSEWRNRWHHCAVAYNNQQGCRSIFIDGVLVNQKTAPKLPFMGLGTIASHTWDSGIARSYRLVGLIDEVRIYNRALSFNEIKQLYNSDVPTPP